MTRMTLLLVAIATMLPTQVHAAFQTCEDAHNYGMNTARLFVSQVFNRAQCADHKLEQTQDALTNVWKTQVLRTNDSDDEKVCYYEGLFTGILHGISSEYDQCGGDGPYGCIERSWIAGIAAAEFYALAQALGDPARAGEEMSLLLLRVDSILAGEPIGACEFWETNLDECLAESRSALPQGFANANADTLRSLARAACTP